jgi:hypothetical protein
VETEDMPLYTESFLGEIMVPREEAAQLSERKPDKYTLTPLSILCLQNPQDREPMKLQHHGL